MTDDTGGGHGQPSSRAARASDSEPAGGLLRRLWRSAFPRPLSARSERERAALTRFTFLLHLRPVRVPANTLRWTHTFGLGGTSLVLVTLLAATGALMMLRYQPDPAAAYASVVGIELEVPFGSLVRGMHWWSANLLIAVVLLHTARVLLTGGMRGPRQFNWVIGCGLLAAVLVAAFTGYLLPWDQLAYWAITISTGMLAWIPAIGDTLQRVARGGEDLGSHTLVAYYTVHTTVVPTILLILMGFHFWRVRRAGGVVAPSVATPIDPDHKPEKVLFLPKLLTREVAQALVVVAAILVLAILLPAPLDEAANPGMSPNPAKAPWYFMGLQEMLIHLHPTWALLVLPVAAALALMLLPYFGKEDEGDQGRWFLSPTGRRTALLAAALALIVVPPTVILDELRTGTPGWLVGGLLPTLAAITLGILVATVSRRRFGAGRNEAIQAVVVLYAVAFAVLTSIGIWCRGEGMTLVWPWLS